MDEYRSLDALVRARLKRWPQRPPGLSDETERNTWLRGRPTDVVGVVQPFLKFPGSDRLRTLPDGLWLNFGGTPDEPYADVFAIEACSSLQNLLDKRSRFAPSTQSMLAVCPVAWLMAPLLANDPFPRWKATGVLREAPVRPLLLPVRDIRVMYGLRARHYQGFAESQVPHPHEFFVPMEALMQENSDQDPGIRTLVARASVTANFFPTPLQPLSAASAARRRSLARV